MTAAPAGLPGSGLAHPAQLANAHGSRREGMAGVNATAWRDAWIWTSMHGIARRTPFVGSKLPRTPGPRREMQPGPWSRR